MEEVEGLRSGGGYACPPVGGSWEVICWEVMCWEVMRENSNVRNSDSPVPQPPQRPGFYNSPSSVQSVHPCQSVILTSGGSRGYACLAGRRELGGYVLGGYVLGGYVLGGYEGKLKREEFRFASSTATSAARVLQFSNFRAIPSSVPIRDSDKWIKAETQKPESPYLSAYGKNHPHL